MNIFPRYSKLSAKRHHCQMIAVHFWKDNEDMKCKERNSSRVYQVKRGPVTTRRARRANCVAKYLLIHNMDLYHEGTRDRRTHTKGSLT